MKGKTPLLVHTPCKDSKYAWHVYTDTESRVACLVRVGGATETWDKTEVGYELQWCVCRIL